MVNSCPSNFHACLLAWRGELWFFPGGFNCFSRIYVQWTPLLQTRNQTDHNLSGLLTTNEKTDVLTGQTNTPMYTLSPPHFLLRVRNSKETTMIHKGHLRIFSFLGAEFNLGASRGGRETEDFSPVLGLRDKFSSVLVQTSRDLRRLQQEAVVPVAHALPITFPLLIFPISHSGIATRPVRPNRTAHQIRLVSLFCAANQASPFSGPIRPNRTAHQIRPISLFCAANQASPFSGTVSAAHQHLVVSSDP